MESLSLTQEELLKRYRKLHDAGPILFDGHRVDDMNVELWTGACFSRKLLRLFCSLLDRRKVKKPLRVLDYGCGKARYVKHVPILFNHDIEEWACYDPGYTKYLAEPTGQFDHIICADVMEHVLEYEETLAKIASLLRDDGIALFSIAGHPDRRAFMDGINLHVTLLTADEWCALIKKHFGDKRVILVYNNAEYWESWNASVRVQVQRVPHSND